MSAIIGQISATPDPAELLWRRRVSGAAYLRNLAVLETCPPLLADALAERHAAIAGQVRTFFDRDGRVADSWNDADADLRRLGLELRQVKPERAFDDDAIEAAADQAARFCTTQTNLASAVEYAEAHGVTVPDGPRVTPASLRKRLRSADWWRRRLRVVLTRRCEELFRRLGFVRRQACAYVSGDALARMRAAAVKGRRWMAETSAVCEETGEALPLAQIAEHSLANPALRRGELMLRARGFQETAEAAGHRCLMVTLTAPSAFHAWLRESGVRNPRYNGATPREAQAWLNTHWARARAALKRREVLYYGFRAAEPHHDATPHWHVVLYVPPEQVGTVKETLAKVWLKDYADEPGAAEYRVKFTDENPAEGSGVAYLAKYVAKNIDGAGSIGAEASDESGRAVSDDAQHAIAWARLHGIRQFQQLGGPAVTLWRELRRVREPCEWEPLEALRLCTDHTDEGGPSFCAFIEQLGGIANSLRRSRELFDKAEPRCTDSAGRSVMRLTRWGELPAPVVIGLRIVWRDRIRRLPTRVHVWFLVFSPHSGVLSALGPVAITVLGAAAAGSPVAWTNPQETSQAPPALAVANGQDDVQ
jgi:Bacteriophage replication gene A protein (GPA)